MNTGLYIHVPFCVRKCPYCDFYSVSVSENGLSGSYTEAVIRNINRYTSEYSDIIFDTVYFGGGTPSFMDSSFFSRVLETAGRNLSPEAEITMEVNPGTVNFEKLNSFRSAGINRISVGIQSASDSELYDLGRIHTFREAAEVVNDGFRAGFTNISADLMIGVKGQNSESLVNSVNSIAGLGVQHVSSYMLKIEPGTPYSRSGISELIPDDDESADMYLLAVRTLAERGYVQYEISNFSQPGFESRHNLKYWHCEEYIGIGPSAHSFFGGKRFEVPRNLSDFIQSEKQNEYINEYEPGTFFEKAMLALRLSEGLDLNRYPEEAPLVLKRASLFDGTGLTEINNNVLRFTPEGFLVSNQLISEILADF